MKDILNSHVEVGPMVLSVYVLFVWIAKFEIFAARNIKHKNIALKRMSTRHHKQLDALNSKDDLTDQEQVKKKKLEKHIARAECSKEATPKKPVTQQVVNNGKKKKKRTKKSQKIADKMMKKNTELLIKALREEISVEDFQKMINRNKRAMKGGLKNKNSKRVQELKESKNNLMIQKKNVSTL